MTMPESLWLRRFHPARPSAPRLICFAHAGGSASYFFPISRALAGRADVVAVQYPGRQNRRAEPAAGSITELADRIAPELRPLADRPLTLFGHSMGATVAYEVARRLEADGVVLDMLFASGCGAPGATLPPRRDLSDARLAAELADLSGTDPQLLADPEVVAMILPALRNDYRVVQSYRHQPGAPLSCPVSVLIGADDRTSTADDVLAWRQHTTGPFRSTVFPGGHFFLNTEARAVLALLEEHLAPGVARGLDAEGALLR